MNSEGYGTKLEHNTSVVIDPLWLQIFTDAVEKVQALHNLGFVDTSTEFRRNSVTGWRSHVELDIPRRSSLKGWRIVYGICQSRWSWIYLVETQ